MTEIGGLFPSFPPPQMFRSLAQVPTGGAPRDTHAPAPHPSPARKGSFLPAGASRANATPENAGRTPSPKNKIAQNIKLRSNARLPGGRHPSCRAGNTVCAGMAEDTPGGLEGRGWLHAAERDHCPPSPSAARGTQTTFSVPQEKAGAGNICFLQTNPRNLGGARRPPAARPRAEPWERRRAARPWQVPPTQHRPPLPCSQEGLGAAPASAFPTMVPSDGRCRAGATSDSTSVRAPTRIPEERHEEEKQRGAGSSHVAKWVTWTRKNRSFSAERLLWVFLTQRAGCRRRAGVFRVIKNRGSRPSSHLENLFFFFCL